MNRVGNEPSRSLKFHNHTRRCRFQLAIINCQPHPRMLNPDCCSPLPLQMLLLSALLLSTVTAQNDLDFWNVERPPDMANIASLEVRFHLFKKYFPNIFRYFLFASNIFVSHTPNTVQVMCGKTHMEVQISFDRPFNGIIFSKGAIDQYNCIYVKPQTGSRAYSFNIMYDQVRDGQPCPGGRVRVVTLGCKCCH